MRVLVTGATGRVGANLVMALIKRGYSVRSMVMPNDPKESKLSGMETEIAYADLRDAEAVEKAVNGVDAIIHSACLMSRPSDMPKSTYFDINVKGTMFLLESAVKRAERIHRFVYVSSDAIYPAAYDPLYTPVDERHPKRPHDEYGMIKALNEDMVMVYQREFGLKVTIVRPGAIAACDEILHNWTAGLVVALFQRAMRYKCGPLFIPDAEGVIEEIKRKVDGDMGRVVIPHDENGKPWLWHRTDVRDVVHGIICALESEAAICEDFNILGPCAIPFDTAVKLLHDKLHVQYEEVRLPVQWVYECDNTKAKTLIGYRPEFDIERMIDDAIAFRSGKDIGVIPP
jgi:UDP-glucose 4-epimerase